MEKLLEIGTWKQFALAVAPSLVVVASLGYLLHLNQSLPSDTAALWIAGAAFFVATSLCSVLLEEAVGRFEPKVDCYLYPKMRACIKLWSAMTPKYRVDCSIYSHHFNIVWDRYLDLTSPTDKSIRWLYYDSLAHRYRVVMSVGMGLFIASLIWFGFAIHDSFSTNSAIVSIALANAFVGAGLFVVSAFILFFEVPSSAWILHWHRVRLLRSDQATRVSNAAKTARVSAALPMTIISPRLRVRSSRLRW